MTHEWTPDNYTKHRIEAERLLEQVTAPDGVIYDNPPALAIIAAAHVHALLAQR